MIKIAMLGAGGIANSMASTLRRMPEIECYAVAARDLNRAEAFADKYGFAKAYGSYEEMVSDPQVELVYIATPHSHHYEHMKLCIEHQKPVLCEKSFTATAWQAREVLQMAKERGVFVTEAIWTRYMPMRGILDELLQSGIIGTPHMMTANLGYLISHIERLAEPALAGGALLDVGVYTLNCASMIFGNDVERIVSTAVLTDKGVDAQNQTTLVYKDGRMAVLCSSMVGMSDRHCIIYGSNGFMEIDNINNYEEIRVYDTGRKLIKTVVKPEQISGYEYQVEACIRALEHGDLECPQMPHEETILMMELMDNLRKQWGVVYPFDRI